MDLPHPDSPTMPCASPGMSVRLKPTTAGISPLRVKNEIERSRHSRTGAAPPLSFEAPPLVELSAAPPAAAGTPLAAAAARSIPSPLID